MDIVRMRSEHISDFIHFHDTVELSHAPHWRGCYCQYYYMDDTEGDWTAMSHELKRTLAVQRVEAGAMNGYLAYAEGEVCAWMSVDDIVRYRRLATKHTFSEAHTTAFVACMLLKSDRRGTGLSAAMLAFALDDLRAQGFKEVLALPFAGQSKEQSYHGSANLYVRLGFIRCEEEGEPALYRFTL